MLAFMRSTVFVVTIILSLSLSTVSLAAIAFNLTTKVATLTATASVSALNHRKELMKAVAKAKAKARLRRLIAATPFVGLVAVGFFEEQDYQEWLEENPEGNRAEYACEVARSTTEIIDEVLQELPNSVRPDPEQMRTILGDIGSCV